MSVFTQGGYEVRLDWGPDGVRSLAPVCTVLVIVDVLSFSTSVDVAVSRGATVRPIGWDAPEPGRQGTWTLRPSSLHDIPAGTELALRSPNGATLTALAAGSGARVYAACLRNAAAVAAALPEGPIGIIAAGERWGVGMGQRREDHTLRPCVEDQLGAGAVAAALSARGLSPEARLAADAFTATADRLLSTLDDCASGRELRAAGHGPDVTVAADLGASTAVPRLLDGVYRS